MRLSPSWEDLQGMPCHTSEGHLFSKRCGTPSFQGIHRVVSNDGLNWCTVREGDGPGLHHELNTDHLDSRLRLKLVPGSRRLWASCFVSRHQVKWMLSAFRSHLLGSEEMAQWIEAVNL